MNARNYSYQNEIEVKVLLKELSREKKIIFLFLTASLLFSLSYIFIKTPIYKAEVVLGKPYESQLLELNVDNIYKVSPATTVVSVVDSFRNGKYLLEFYRNNRKLFTNYLIDERNIEVNLMNVTSAWKVNSLKIEKKEIGFFSFAIEYPEIIEGHNLLNKYIEFIIEEEKKIYLNELKEIVKSKISLVEKYMNASKLAYEIEKQAKIEMFDEAIITAKAIGLKKPYEQENDKSNTVLKAQINNQQNPLYYRGYDALEAEKKVLLEREKDELFIAELVELKKKLFLLNKIDPENKKILIVNWVKKAFKQEEKIEPRNLLVILLSILVGLIIAFLKILIKMTFEK
ncbi:Wzz/FepE/Etk N-terminal domain-containing protein [Zooshikella harenae]|uniref:Polysaccharide chain length determinant N-terminal domain-containing protein n=1 Tax=Zooshikella harenae TaxID=2827238 RepID=A0ABS5Z8N4_9GAMM|nr:Wzz/FepE/Etk N-terminal domain-containing protein [Zooshikella harenae]MBU2710365.1 hypothetical protein [Zooshikella harenae]